MGSDLGDSFPFNFEPNGIPVGSKSKGRLSPRSYPIQFERKSNMSFLSVDLRIKAYQSKNNQNLFNSFIRIAYQRHSVAASWNLNLG